MAKATITFEDTDSGVLADLSFSNSGDNDTPYTDAEILARTVYEFASIVGGGYDSPAPDIAEATEARLGGCGS